MTLTRRLRRAFFYSIFSHPRSPSLPRYFAKRHRYGRLFQHRVNGPIKIPHRSGGTTSDLFRGANFFSRIFFRRSLFGTVVFPPTIGNDRQGEIPEKAVV